MSAVESGAWAISTVNSSPPIRASSPRPARAGANPARRFDQNGVAEAVPLGVVDELEVIDVDEEQAGPVGRVQRELCHRLQKLPSVGETGERVVERLKRQVRLDALSLGDVGADADEVPQPLFDLRHGDIFVEPVQAIVEDDGELLGVALLSLSKRIQRVLVRPVPLFLGTSEIELRGQILGVAFGKREPAADGLVGDDLEVPVEHRLPLAVEQHFVGRVGPGGKLVDERLPEQALRMGDHPMHQGRFLDRRQLRADYARHDAPTVAEGNRKARRENLYGALTGSPGLLARDVGEVFRQNVGVAPDASERFLADQYLGRARADELAVGVVAVEVAVVFVADVDRVRDGAKVRLCHRQIRLCPFPGTW